MQWWWRDDRSQVLLGGSQGCFSHGFLKFSSCSTFCCVYMHCIMTTLHKARQMESEVEVRSTVSFPNFDSQNTGSWTCVQAENGLHANVHTHQKLAYEVLCRESRKGSKNRPNIWPLPRFKNFQRHECFDDSRFCLIFSFGGNYEISVETTKFWWKLFRWKLIFFFSLIFFGGN
jgi:hypothetical protein